MASLNHVWVKLVVQGKVKFWASWSVHSKFPEINGSWIQYPKDRKVNKSQYTIVGLSSHLSFLLLLFERPKRSHGFVAGKKTQPLSSHLANLSSVSHLSPRSNQFWELNHCLLLHNTITYIYIYIYIYGLASKFGYGSARGDPDVWIGLDHLRFGMDRGYGSACGFRVWIGALHFDS